MKKSIVAIISLLIIAACSSDPKPTENKAQAPVTEETVDSTDSIPETPAIDTNWNFYAGTAGLYDSQIVMELAFIDSTVYGSYWYSKHKKRIRLTGVFDEKDQKYVMDESHKGKVTGRITFRIKDDELVGRWYAPKSTGEGESFYCEKVVSDSKNHLNPVFDEYKFDHKIEVFNSELDEFDTEVASDHCMISKISNEKFMFVYDVIGHNYHVGYIEGIGTYLSSTTGQFTGEEGCTLKFNFGDQEVEIDETESCDYYKGYRAYFGGTLVKTN